MPSPIFIDIATYLPSVVQFNNESFYSSLEQRVQLCSASFEALLQHNESAVLRQQQRLRNASRAAEDKQPQPFEPLQELKPTVSTSSTSCERRDGVDNVIEGDEPQQEPQLQEDVRDYCDRMLEELAEDMSIDLTSL